MFLCLPVDYRYTAEVVVASRIEEHSPERENPIVDSSEDFYLQESLGETIEVSLVEDATESSGLGRIEGVAGKAGIVNRNKRLYTETIYALAVERAKTLLQKGRFLGEVDHPMFGSLQGAAFRFTEVFMDEDLMRYEGVILETPGGRLLKGLLEGGVGVAVSTRGYGSIKYETMDVEGEETEVGVIQDDYRMEGIDFVLFPSNPHGEVTHHENTRFQQESSMTIEELREKYPELVEQIEEAAREGYVSEADLDTAVEEARDEVLESDDIVALRTFRSDVVEAIRPHVPELAEAAEEAEKSETEQELESLRQEFEAINERLKTVEEERDELQEEQKEAERQKAVTEKADELLEGYTHKDLIRDELIACESVEQVEETFEARRTLIESLVARGDISEDEIEKGSGAADTEDLNEDEETPDEVVENVTKAQQRKLAGLD